MGDRTLRKNKSEIFFASATATEPHPVVSTAAHLWDPAKQMILWNQLIRQLVLAFGGLVSGRTSDYPVAIPKLGEFILYLVLPKVDREHVPGDLEEEFRTTIVPKFGPAKARLWYWWQVIRSIVIFLFAAVQKVAGLFSKFKT